MDSKFTLIDHSESLTTDAMVIGGGVLVRTYNNDRTQLSICFLPETSIHYINGKNYLVDYNNSYNYSH